MSVGEYTTDEFDKGLINDVCKWALKHLPLRIDVDDICKQVGKPPKVVSCLFETYKGQLPGAWLRSVRLERARMLLNRGLDISIVVPLVGYASPSSFRAAYRKQYGVIPNPRPHDKLGPEDLIFKNEHMESIFTYRVRKEIQDYLVRNLGKDLTTVAIEDKFKLPERGLETMCEYYYKKCYKSYRREIRMTEAKRILTSKPSLPLRKVAELVGSCSTMYLNRQFKETFGVTAENFVKEFLNEKVAC